MKEIDRRRRGMLYSPYRTGDPSWQRARTLLPKINETADWQQSEPLFRQLLGSLGRECTIVPPFYCDLGRNIFLEDHVFINMDFLALDEGEIHIEKNVLIGPRVSIYTPVHPYDPEVRLTGLETCRPVVIREGAWICGSCVLTPGVTIGRNAIIGAGSVVTHDIEDNVIAAGNPCRVIRPVLERDRQEWQGLYRDYAADPDTAG